MATTACSAEDARLLLSKHKDPDSAVQAFWEGIKTSPEDVTAFARAQQQASDSERNTSSSSATAIGSSSRRIASKLTPAHRPRYIAPQSGDTDSPKATDRQNPSARNLPPDLYAGGGSSGLAIQDPTALQMSHRATIAEIIQLADANGEANNPSRLARSTDSRHWGSGRTLGSEVRLSAAAASDESSEPYDNDEAVTQQLTFWQDGFSIENGPLLRYEENQELLEQLRAGYAPRELFKARLQQRLDVHISDRMTELYKREPRKPVTSFSGSGQRLGAHMPSERVSTSPAASLVRPGFVYDPARPTTRIQIRISDGVPLTIQANQDQTIGDIRRFVREYDESRDAFQLQTTYPVRILTDDEQTIKDAKLLNSSITVKPNTNA